MLGLDGWQWVYIAWGLPAVLLGFVVLFVMPDRPAQARWLTAEERDALTAIVAAIAPQARRRTHLSVMQALRQPVVLLLAAANFLVVIGHYGVDFFLPTILQSWYGSTSRR